MSNFIARCAAIGLVGGGFALTGDLGRLTARGMQVVNARTIPAAQPAAEPTAGPSRPAGASSGPRDAIVPSDPIGPAEGRAADGGAAPVTDGPPPTTGPASIDLATLRPGNRVSIWIGRPAGGGTVCLKFDLVDPAVGEALLMTPGMAARRVTIRAARGRRPSVLATGDGLLVAAVGPAHHGAAGGETLGPITALAVGR